MGLPGAILLHADRLGSSGSPLNIINACAAPRAWPSQLS